MARLAVFSAVEPLFGPVHRGKFEDHNALRIPIAFEYFGFTAANDVFATFGMNGGRRLLFVFFITDWVGHFDFNNYIGRHREN